MKRWITAEADESLIQSLSADVGITRQVARILVLRGVSTAGTARDFLNPRLSLLGDPFQIPGMQKAAERLYRAVSGSERVVVFGDYDADGITATALLVSVLREMGGDAGWCLPQRVEEGYGLSVEGMERCLGAEAGARLVVTVDCGTNDVGGVAFAMKRGIDVIVTDHHEPSNAKSEPLVLVNPRIGAPTGAEFLSGVGVAFKLCHAMIKIARNDGVEGSKLPDLRNYLDLVAVGTVADVVPLTGENRILAKHGLDRIATTSNVGLKALVAEAGLAGRPSSRSVGFIIGPRLNAIGRLGCAEPALELLLETDPGRANELACTLEKANRERRELEQKQMHEAFEQVDKACDLMKDYGIVVGSDSWHPGVVGLVASRLCDKYRRPAVAIAWGADGEGRGSGRSVPAFDLTAGLMACSNHLVKCGGHRLAAGLSIKRDSYDSFRSAFLQQCSIRLAGHDLSDSLDVDAWLDLADVEMRLLSELEQLRPFGEGNDEPVWACRGVKLAGPPVIMKELHLKMTLVAGMTQLKAVAWRMAGRAIPDGSLDVAFCIERDSFMGRDGIQLRIVDFRPSA